MKPEEMKFDELTRLPSRLSFESSFKEAMQDSIDLHEPLSLAFIDIDEFLVVNETNGHLAGDAVLTGVAELLSENCGTNAITGRYGGDEFVVLIPGAEREQAFLVIERLRAAVDHRHVYQINDQQFSVQVTVSAGIASYPIDGQNEVELLRKADRALYRAKEHGRNTIRLAYDERMVPKTTHYTLTQLERLTKLAQEQGCSEAELLREALDDLLLKYQITEFVR